LEDIGVVPKRAVCGAQKVKGGICMQDAGARTDHKGIGRCYLHMGNVREGKQAAGVTIGEGQDIDGRKIMGVPERMEPSTALLWCVAITAGEVRYLTGKVQELDEEGLYGAVKTGSYERGQGERGRKSVRVTAWGPPELHILVKERQKAVDRLARYSKMAIDAGVAERQIALAEHQAGMLTAVFLRIFDQVKLTAAQRRTLEPVLERELLVLESGDMVT
jgi:hypothetical protein